MSNISATVPLGTSGVFVMLGYSFLVSSFLVTARDPQPNYSNYSGLLREARMNFGAPFYLVKLGV